MTRNISLLFFLALILASISAQTQCPQNNPKDFIQTGLIQFENTNQRQACKQVDIKFTIPNRKLQIVAAVISLQNYKLISGIDFSIKVAPKANISKFAATLLSDHTSNWTKIKVSYLASSRNDMLLGSFLTDSFQTLKCLQNQNSQKNVALVSHVVKGWTKDFTSVKPVIFISGIKAISLSLTSLKVSSAELNASGVLNVQLQSLRGLQLQYVQLSYVLINSSFPYQYGIGLNITEYSLPIFSQIINTSLSLQKWGIFTGSLICEGTQCTKTCFNKQECSKALGNQLNGRCIICEKGTVWNASKCVTICGQNQIWNGQICVCDSKAIRVNTSCILCVPNSTPDKSQKQCICNNGFVWNSWLSSCITFICPENALPQPNEKGYNCVCKAGFYPSENVCKAIPQCPLNSAFNITSQTCVCNIQGQFIFNNTCIACGINQQFDVVTQKCVCKPNFFVSVGSCVSCPQFSTLNQDKTRCVCNEGYIWSDFKTACLPFKCPLNALPNVTEAGVKCNCVVGFYVNGQNCEAIPKCPTGAIFDLIQKVCICEKKTAIIINGQCLECPPNSSWNGTQCVCNAGFTVVNGACAVSCGKNEVLENNTCVCNTKSISINKTCQLCPLNASSNKQKTQCLCDTGFKWDDVSKTCTKIVCPENSVLKVANDTTTCVCIEGYTPQGSTCLRVGKCPVNSVWSQDKLTCVCSIQGQYLVNNECRKIGINQEWSQKDRSFVCKKGFNLISGQCRVCEIGEHFDGVGCSCNLGFYRNGFKCEACHSSCGTCSGPNANQCLNCSDITLTFKNGSCTKDKPCPRGLYQKGASCLPCSTYCSDCTSDCVCNSCINGFQLQSITYANISASYCVEKCGDGKRFELECDDGNNKNGDGCSADCKIEQGWSCSGGSSTSASVCMLGNPDRTHLQLTGTVHLYGRIVQGVRLSYIPEALVANGCTECYNLLWVRVIRSDIVPGVRINYLPASRYQFLVQLEFHGTFAIPSFTIAIQINPQYAKYFNMKDMAQIQIKTIDPALLARKDTEDQLSLDDISQNKQIQVSKQVVNQIFKP